MKGVYVIYEPTVDGIEIIFRLYFTDEEEEKEALQIINIIRDKIHSNTSRNDVAVGLIMFNNNKLDIDPWVVPPKMKNKPIDVWLNALQNAAPRIYLYIIEEESTEPDDIPLYSKLLLDDASQIIVFMTHDGHAFVLLEFERNLLKSLTHGLLDTIQTYPVFNSYSFNYFKNVYSFRFTVEESNKTLKLYSPQKNIPYTNKVCLIKPILQTRGFCYYHAVLHGMLIPPGFKWLCSYRLLEYMESLQEGKYERYTLDNFMNTEICEDFKYLPDKLRDDTTYFVMKFFYQYLFYYDEMTSQINLNKLELQKKYLKKYPSPVIHPHPLEVLVYYSPYGEKYRDTTLENLPEGGNVGITMYNLLRKVLNIPTSRLIEHGSIIYSQYIIYKYDREQHVFYSEDIDKNKLEPHGYTLEFGLIGLDFTTIGTNRNKGHDIVGINCNGKKYIIDSNDGIIHECNWTIIRLLYNHPYIQGFLQKMSEAYQLQLKSIQISYYFINNNNVKKMAELPNPMKTIKDTFIRDRLINKLMQARLEASMKDKLYDIATRKGYSGTIQTYEMENPETWTLPARRGGGNRKKKGLNALTVKELQERCAKKHLACKGLRKAELIALLRDR